MKSSIVRTLLKGDSFSSHPFHFESQEGDEEEEEVKEKFCKFLRR